MTKKGCCGGAQPTAKYDQRQRWPFSWSDDNAVEAEFIRGGSLSFSGLGHHPRIRYPRTTKGQRIWVHHEDAAAEKNRPGGAYFRPLEAPDRDIQEAIRQLQEKVKHELT